MFSLRIAYAFLVIGPVGNVNIVSINCDHCKCAVIEKKLHIDIKKKTVNGNLRLISSPSITLDLLLESRNLGNRSTLPGTLTSKLYTSIKRSYLPLLRS